MINTVWSFPLDKAGGQGGDNSHKNIKIIGNILCPQYTLHY